MDFSVTFLSQHLHHLQNLNLVILLPTLSYVLAHLMSYVYRSTFPSKHQFTNQINHHLLLSLPSLDTHLI